MARREFPTSLKIGKHTWEIIHSDKHEEADSDDLGFCDPTEHIIWVSTRQSDKGRLYTIMHEILHAIEFEYKIKIPHSMVYALEKPLGKVVERNFLNWKE